MADMNILYILQQSIYNAEKPSKWLTLDSNINMMVGILSQLVVTKPSWKFYVLIAPLSDFANITSYDEIMKHPNVVFIPYKQPVNAFLLRQHFDVELFDSTVKNLNVKFDVVWNNITELSRNIKTWFHVNYSKDDRPKLITCCYWLDCQEIPGQAKVASDIAYQWRQVDGFECSDLAVFTCRSTLDAFEQNGRKFVSEDVIARILDKSRIWDFGYSLNEITSHIQADGFKSLQQELVDKSEGFPIVTFLNRMSDNNYTRHLDFIDAIDALYERNPNFRVVYANPSQKIPWKYLQDRTKNMLLWRDRALTRKEYFALLTVADTSVHLYTNELYGGCAHREAVECGAKIVCPAVNEYRRIHGDDWPFYVEVNKLDEFANLDVAISRAITTPFEFEPKFGEAISRCRKLSAFEIVHHNVVTDIEGLFHEKQDAGI